MTGRAEAPAIRVDGLVKRYDGHAVVDGVSFDVGHGELVAVLGPNGAGKTTTIEIIEGYRRPDAGSVRVLGTDPAAGGRDLRARVGLMLQEGGIDPRARPRETIAQYARFHADPLDPDEVLDLVGLRHVARRAYRRLSGGERQRLGLALALVGRPEVLVLDEPTAGMDPEARVATRAIVMEQRAAGAAILLTSHDLTEVERVADRIVVLDRGRVVADDRPGGIGGPATASLSFRLDAPLDADALHRLSASVASTHAEARIEAGPGSATYRVIGVAPDPALVAVIASTCVELGRLIVASGTSGGSLEDRYLALLERHREREQ
jgi:ABC-2 type transport system ATP-binding protein